MEGVVPPVVHVRESDLPGCVELSAGFALFLWAHSSAPRLSDDITFPKSEPKARARR
jgi:hypothetical protein